MKYLKLKISFHKFTIYRKTHYSGFGVTEYSYANFYLKHTTWIQCKQPAAPFIELFIWLSLHQIMETLYNCTIDLSYLTLLLTLVLHNIRHSFVGLIEGNIGFPSLLFYTLQSEEISRADVR